jgi:hypothetical protein
MIYAIIFLGITNALTVAGWAWSATLEHRERRILLSAALAAQNKPMAAVKATTPTAAEDRARFEAEQKLTQQIRDAAAPYSALNPFGRT